MWFSVSYFTKKWFAICDIIGMTNCPSNRRGQSRDVFKFWEISNISEAVQDRDVYTVVTTED